MCRSATALLLALPLLASAQTATPSWRHIGTSTLDLGLAGPAGGAVDRAWYSPDGARLSVRTAFGRVFTTTDFESWTASDEPALSVPEAAVDGKRPETRALLRPASLQRMRVYAAGKQAWRSDDGGVHWTNLTQFQSESILGGTLSDLAVSPSNPDELTVVGATGVWRSLDAGLTWSSVNSGLPSLVIDRIVRAPKASEPMRVAGAFGEAEWHPSSAGGWSLTAPTVLAAEAARKAAAAQVIGAEITAIAAVGNVAYAGASDGRLWASTDSGRTWTRANVQPSGLRVTALYADPKDPLFAVAAISGPQKSRVLKTTNGGLIWDEVGDASGIAAIRGVTADRASETIYVASSRGVLMNTGANWMPTVEGLPAAAATDVKLNDAGHQLYVAVEGYGVYATIAPHRTARPEVVSAGDLSYRAAAPGALLTVLGSTVSSATAGGRELPVLAQSQVQIPFDVSGTQLGLSLRTAAGNREQTMALESAAPALFIDADGGALVTNADTGLLLDASTPIKPGTHLEFLATGLGQVTPEWPVGVAAPANDVPQVRGKVTAYLDRSPVQVIRATLAPGYIGIYIVEVELSTVLNSGTAEFYIDVDGHSSNRVKLYIEQNR